MAVVLSAKTKMLLLGPNFGNLATVLANGSPHVAPVWVDYDGKHLIVNTAEGRQKMLNIRRDPRVAISVMNAENPYQWVGIRGRVVEIIHEGADEHIDKMAKKYLGQDKYPMRRPEEQRVILKIESENVIGNL